MRYPLPAVPERCADFSVPLDMASAAEEIGHRF
jgi:hypothetical protein